MLLLKVDLGGRTMNHQQLSELIPKLRLCLVCFVILSVGQVTRGAQPAHGLPDMTTGIWKASFIGADCMGPSDANGHSWYEPDFDDSQWTDVQLPEVNTVPSGQDRYYRLHYNLVASPTTRIYLSSDDGAWGYM